MNPLQVHQQSSLPHQREDGLSILFERLLGCSVIFQWNSRIKKPFAIVHRQGLLCAREPDTTCLTDILIVGCLLRLKPTPKRQQLPPKQLLKSIQQEFFQLQQVLPGLTHLLNSNSSSVRILEQPHQYIDFHWETLPLDPPPLQDLLHSPFHLNPGHEAIDSHKDFPMVLNALDEQIRTGSIQQLLGFPSVFTTTIPVKSIPQKPLNQTPEQYEAHSSKNKSVIDFMVRCNRDQVTDPSPLRTSQPRSFGTRIDSSLIATATAALRAGKPGRLFRQKPLPVNQTADLTSHHMVLGVDAHSLYQDPQFNLRLNHAFCSMCEVVRRLQIPVTLILFEDLWVQTPKGHTVYLHLPHQLGDSNSMEDIIHLPDFSTYVSEHRSVNQNNASIQRIHLLSMANALQQAIFESSAPQGWLWYVGNRPILFPVGSRLPSKKMIQEEHVRTVNVTQQILKDTTDWTQPSSEKAQSLLLVSQELHKQFEAYPWNIAEVIST